VLKHESRDASRSTTLPAGLMEGLRQLHWPTLLSGVALGLAFMQVLVARTVTTRVDQLAREVAQTRQQVAALAGSHDDVNRTNDLLSLLNRQRDELRHANESVAELRRLRARVGQEGTQLTESMGVLDRIRKLQSEIVAQIPQLDQSTRAVAAATALQKRVSEMARSLPAQAAGIAEAEASLAQLADLKQRVLNFNSDLPAAREQLEGLAVLMKGLANSNDKMLLAKAAASELLAMKNMLIVESEDIDRSQRNAEQLIGLNDTLMQAKQIQVDEAANNLNAMIKIQQRLAGQTRMIAGNVDNLDLLADFQLVLGEQLGKMDGLRRQLTDLVLMESSIARAAQTLAPLAQLGTMKNLDEEEVREAARVILNRRASRSDTTRTADGAAGDVISISSPDEVFEEPARPAPVPPTE
jgi:DNA repair exonuclease SbcCD ATPase subunit